MASNNGVCHKCQNECVFRDTKNELFGYPCDICKKIVCKNCCNISASEIRVVLMVSRIMPFVCQSCRDNLFNLPNIVKRIDDLEATVHTQGSETIARAVALEQRVVKLEQSLGDLSKVSTALPTPASSINIVDEADIISEVLGRQRRATNVMIFNCEVHNGQAEAAQVGKFFTEICGQPVDINSVSKIGKPNRNGHKALKVVLNSVADVNLVLRNRAKAVNTKKIFIEADLTPKQRSSLNEVRSELKRRKENGEENLSLKYVDGIPRIVAKN